ncbi:sulfatase-like hydrolase/transferase [Pseudodesulfovibrio sp. zrk46]|uniref:sulfatase-like hydrolase/transferase n=1 Tax=Pseudodesulfovibrio sp. zrk46 TaxID=2725288 RepID=UPI00144A0B9B|nr:sulfatase-like hydrolase/transferase [Pseudodesulfovibrio sp. zrk46]QJB57412.1 sulfatase-like hydrolase/transferase [Pseudodesulfovibrio sp. zrk46]
MGYVKKRRNIIWLCVDGLRADSLQSAGNNKVERHFIDDVASRGAFFPNCIAAAQSTISSSASFFTSMTPEMCRQPTQTANCIPQFHPDAVTIADILKAHGYSTFRWNDMDTYSCHAKTGFDHYEAGYFGLRSTPNLSFDAEKRDDFLQKFKECSESKFIYMHLLHLHEYGGESARVWTGQKYLHHVREVADEVAGIVDKLGVCDDDILMIHSDHGVTLNQDFVEFEERHGGTFAEGRIRVFSVFKCDGIEPSVYPGVVGNIDLAPTLLEMVGIDQMKGLGKSLLPVITDGAERGGPILACWTSKPTHPLHVIGGECPSFLDSVCLRDDDWKYTVFRNGEKTLIDLRPGAEDLVDVKSEHPDLVEKYEKLYKEMYLDLPETPHELYQQTGQTFFRSDIVPETSFLMPVHTASVNLRKSILSLIDQLGYFEILVLDGDESGGVAELMEEYSDDHRIRHIPVYGIELGKMLNDGLAKSRGKYIATVSAEYRYTEHYLYILLNALKSSTSSDFCYADAYQFYKDPRKTDYNYIGPYHFYFRNAKNQGGVGSHRYLGLRSHSSMIGAGYVGDVALFTRELIEAVGGFDESGDSIKSTWAKMGRHTDCVNIPVPLLLSDGLLSRPTFGLPSPASHHKKISVVLCGDDPSLFWPTLESLQNQSETNFEVVMAATQKQLATVSSLAERFFTMEMQLCVVDETASLDYKCNVLTSKAKGKFLTWCQAGTLLPSSYLEELVAAIDANPESSFVNASRMLTGDGNKKQIITAHDVLLKDVWMSPQSIWGILYRRRLHDEIGLFDAKVGSAGMWDMVMRIVETGRGVPVPNAILMQSSLHMDVSIEQSDSMSLYKEAVNRMGGLIDLGMINNDLFSESREEDYLEPVLARFVELLKVAPFLMELNVPVIFNGVQLDIKSERQTAPPSTNRASPGHETAKSSN